MRDWMRLPQRARLAYLLAVLAIGSGGELTVPRAGWADASGCTLHPKTHADEDANCAGGGDGCYLCEYSNSGGYTTCSESPDGTDSYCTSGQHALNQSGFGVRWFLAVPPDALNHGASDTPGRAAGFLYTPL